MKDPERLSLPPGIFDTGTDYDNRGRWHEGNRVRWERGTARPIGGWSKRINSTGADIATLISNTATEAARNIITWQDNALSTHIVVGTNSACYHISDSGTVTDITPGGFVGGSKEPVEVTGYGVGQYGKQAYGTPRVGENLLLAPAALWSFDMWGDILLAQFRGSGPLYQFDPDVDVDLTPIVNAPTDSQAVLVTDQRIAMLLRTDQRTVDWCDSEDFTDWTPAVTNTAGSYSWSGTGKPQELKKVGTDILLLTSVDVWVGRYIKPPYIYGFEKVGQNVGCYGANNVVVTSSRAYWIGAGGFWTYGQGSRVEQLQSELEDYYEDDHSQSDRSKTAGWLNTEFNEVTWHYQSQTSPTGEPDAYIAFRTDENIWLRGVLDRTCGAPAGPTPSPVLVGQDGFLYNHELRGVIPGNAEGDDAPHLVSGPLELGTGGQKFGVRFIFPDAEPRSDGVILTLMAKDMPTVPEANERTYGPYTVTTTGDPIPTTGAQGRQMRLKAELTSAAAILGSLRLDIFPMGGR